MKIACPVCKTTIKEVNNRSRKLENCNNCNFEVKLLHGVPILRTLQKNEVLDILEQSQTLPVQDSSTLEIPFVCEALESNKNVLQLGAGVDKCNLPHLTKTDAYLYSKDLHYLVDAHQMPFLDNTFDYVYSLAVFEHLHSPWIAAEEIFRILKPGGKVFVLTAFMQHMHGYPHHYFNMTTSGLERIFNSFEILICEPSKHSSITQIAHIMADLHNYIQNTRFDSSLNDKITILNESIHSFCQIIPELDSKIMQKVKEQISLFSKISPAIEIIARKPN